MSKVTFYVEELLAEAKLKAGLDNFGNPRFREGLEILLETIDNHVKGDEYRNRQRNAVLGRLVTRLEIQEAFRMHPQILEQEVKQPIFVTGLPRSGTSALFNLLDSDPDARALLLWETSFPQPLEGLPAGVEDPRLRGTKEYLDSNRDPEMDKIHFTSADYPEECCLIQVLSFDGVATGWEYLQEPYHSWFKSHSLDFMYEEHRDHLKLLQWQRPGTRWLLKAPAHMWAIDEIVPIFPDACLVWGHREPVGVTASICSMTEKMVYGMNFGGISDEELKILGPRIMDWYAMSLERGLAAREQVIPDRYFDYGFKDFVADPRATVQGIYDHFQLPMGAATRQALDYHIAKNSKGKHGKHEYDLARYGLTEQQVLDRYKFYLENNELV